MNLSRILIFVFAVAILWLSATNVSAKQSRLQNQSGLAVQKTSSSISTNKWPVDQDSVFEATWSGGIPRSDVIPDSSKKGLNIPIRIRMEGDAVRVDIRVGLVSFKEVDVATYLIRPDETVIVQEVESYGFEPFGLKVIRIENKPPVVIPPRNALPEMDNNLNTIKVVGLEKGKSADEYLLSLQNTGTKNLVALEITMPTGGTRQELSEPGKPLIPSGAIYKINISAQTAGRITDEGFEPGSVQPKGIINAALFEDGTYEGDHVAVAIMEAWRRGREIQIERIISLLEKTQRSDTPGSSVTIEFVREEIYSLGVEGDALAVEEISKNYAPLIDEMQYIVQGIKGAMAAEKYDLIYKFKAYEERMRTARTDDLRIWLKRTKADYENKLRLLVD